MPFYIVVLTIDDGYTDFYDIAFPELKRRSRAATFFVTTDFADCKIWLWPDRIRFTLEHAKVTRIDFPIGPSYIHIDTKTENSRDKAWNLLVDYCVHVDDQENSE